MRRIALLLPLIFSSTCQSSPLQIRDGTLSPRQWENDDLSTFTRLNAEWGRPQAVASANEGMVLGTTGPLAIRAGLQTLKCGGSAADAAVTTALAQITLSAGSWNSFAGICQLLYYDSSTREVHSLNAGYNRPLGEQDPLSIPKSGVPSGRSVLVPGFMAGIEAIHRRFGKLSYAHLFEPAVFFAEEGFVLDDALSRLIESRKDVLTRLPETRAIFQKSDGALYRRGDLFRQPLLATTLRRLAADGAGYMYAGEWARKFVEAVQREGGKLTLEDLQHYQVQWPQPLCAQYRGRDVVTGGLPDFGPIQLIEELHLLDCANLRQMGSPQNSPQSLYTLIQAARLGPLITHSQPYQPYSDPRTPVTEFSPETRTSPAAGARNRERIQKKDWQLELFQQLSQPAQPHHSDAVIGVDRNGNIAVLVHTINTVNWGTTGIFVDGVSIPDSAAFQQVLLAKISPGRRLPSEITPLIVLDKGQPRLAAGSIGASLQEATLQNLVSIMDFEMDLASAVEVPKFFGMGSAAGRAMDWPKQIVSRSGFSANIRAEVEKMGQPLLELSDAEAKPYVGYWLGLEVKAEGLRGIVTPGLNGIALGY
jgi:gamma-glutamyltranspeptidase/glutathione hydrolase